MASNPMTLQEALHQSSETSLRQVWDILENLTVGDLTAAVERRLPGSERRLDDVLREPGVEVQKMTREVAERYIFEIGLIATGLVESMALGGHKTLAGNLRYIDVDDDMPQGMSDFIIFLKRATGSSQNVRNKPELLAEAVARIKAARAMVLGQSSCADDV